MYDFNKLYEPTSVKEALSLKKENPKALFLAGGSDILIKLRNGKYSKCDLISIYALDELRGVELDENQNLIIKPLCSFTQVASSPLIKSHLSVLAEAVEHIGGPQIRNIGTIGGNICNGVTSADSASTFKAYDAILEIQSADNKRFLNYADFNLAPSKVALEEDELLTAIIIKKESYDQTYGHYIKYAMRKAMDIATLGCSANVKLSNDKKRLERFRIAFGVAAPTPIRSNSAEEIANGQIIDDKLIEAIGEATLKDVMPRTSWRASKEFRLHLVKELAKRSTKIAIEKAGGSFNA